MLVPLLPRAKSVALCRLAHSTLQQEVRLTKHDFQYLVRHTSRFAKSNPSQCGAQPESSERLIGYDLVGWRASWSATAFEACILTASHVCYGANRLLVAAMGLYECQGSCTLQIRQSFDDMARRHILGEDIAVLQRVTAGLSQQAAHQQPRTVRPYHRNACTARGSRQQSERSPIQRRYQQRLAHMRMPGEFRSRPSRLR